MNYLYPLNAISPEGRVILLYTVDAVYDFIKKNGRFHEHRYYWIYDFGNYVNKKHVSEWIIRDDRGRIVKYEDFPINYEKYYNRRRKEIREIAAKGLPIPGTGCSKAGYKMNHTAKKNSGAGHRNRNRALAIYEAKEYQVDNNIGGRVIPWENY